jgi:hypothetical protein
VRHADDDETDAGPRVEPVVHQPQLGRVRLHENGGERCAKATAAASSSILTGMVAGLGG